ncbi:DUF5655 domain-containing protein [Mucilaginibacter sp. BT774]|uniref:DUF5655 domain-containing protein n=1 Tax=Mucilaginibacter sp. BT774 TaxID=3062276 RepID=UPI002674CE01|nr:DUF5655 domain-containing protein [Mucilaginibacter sp. BT774]MDO3628824.1 DUF5655 domain-containing protein [Mucilaginibacter sp. BT774]
MEDYYNQDDSALQRFLNGKSEQTLTLFHHFVNEFQKVGPVTLHPAKTMIGVANSHKRIAYITQLGKNFIHVVFPLRERYEDNFCFQKIAQVPGDMQFNHHFRMLHKEDVNEEVIDFMRLVHNS